MPELKDFRNKSRTSTVYHEKTHKAVSIYNLYAQHIACGDCHSFDHKRQKCTKDGSWTVKCEKRFTINNNGIQTTARCTFSFSKDYLIQYADSRNWSYEDTPPTWWLLNYTAEEEEDFNRRRREFARAHTRTGGVPDPGLGSHSDQVVGEGPPTYEDTVNITPPVQTQVDFTGINRRLEELESRVVALEQDLEEERNGNYERNQTISKLEVTVSNVKEELATYQIADGGLGLTQDLDLSEDEVGPSSPAMNQEQQQRINNEGGYKRTYSGLLKDTQGNVIDSLESDEDPGDEPEILVGDSQT